MATRLTLALSGFKMKSRHKWICRALLFVAVVYVSLFSARLIFSWVDYSRIDSFHMPVFSKPGTHANGGFVHFADGGTTNFVGFGYDITMMQRIDTSADGVDGYQYGPKLMYRWRTLFFPLPNSENVRFVPTTELYQNRNAR